MTGFKLVEFQQEAVDRIVERLRDKSGSRRILLADEVGLGKTVVARHVIEKLQGHRGLTVIYICSNGEIAAQNCGKLDPAGGNKVERVSELALDAQRGRECRELQLYSFTPGTSLKPSTGKEWERRLILFLLVRAEIGKPNEKAWREFFRCSVNSEKWTAQTRWSELENEFNNRITVNLQREVNRAWRVARTEDDESSIKVLRESVESFDANDDGARTKRNRLVAQLRVVFQRVILEQLKPDLVILDEVQRFPEVLEDSEGSEPARSPTLASVLFKKGVPVLILSATPYRSLTMSHEGGDGQESHHEGFTKTLAFLFRPDKVVPKRIHSNLAKFRAKLAALDSASLVSQDSDLLKFKRDLERDLTKVICRTERNWYVLDRCKGVETSASTARSQPSPAELEEYFRLHKALPHSSSWQISEYWKSAPSLLTFLDRDYVLFKELKSETRRVPGKLLTAPKQIGSLQNRTDRIARVMETALGPEGTPPRLWTCPTLRYYEDKFFGDTPPSKVLVFSGWRFVPKTVAIITSQGAITRLPGKVHGKMSSPLSFKKKISFFVFDVCFPSPVLAEIGALAYERCRNEKRRDARDVVDAAVEELKKRFKVKDACVKVIKHESGSPWDVAMRLERDSGSDVVEALGVWVKNDLGEAVRRAHVQRIEAWVDAGEPELKISERRLKQLAHIASFSPANCVLRAFQSVYGKKETDDAYPSIVQLCLGPLRHYFNRPPVQHVINERHSVLWSKSRRKAGYAERVIAYSADGHFQAVLDEFLHFHHRGTNASIEDSITRFGSIWELHGGRAFTNYSQDARGSMVQVARKQHGHATHFGLAFGDDVVKSGSSGEEEKKARKSVVREAFNSPFWPFVLATTSVGQEGLDFHLYCKDVFHWNLPSNPVDLEQREGRIHRCDCLAVRQSIARNSEVAGRGMDDTWTEVFNIVKGDKNQKYMHGMFPHWVYECKESVKIRRHTSFFNLSSDKAKYNRLVSDLQLYRLAFGQPNQEELLRTLQGSVGGEPDESNTRRLASYMLNLSPIGHQFAINHARKEAKKLIEVMNGSDGLEKLLKEVRNIRKKWKGELSVVSEELDKLVQIVKSAMAPSTLQPSGLLEAVAALEYLRNPYDKVFDAHVEGGFADDIEVVRNAWTKIPGIRKGRRATR